MSPSVPRPALLIATLLLAGCTLELTGLGAGDASAELRLDAGEGVDGGEVDGDAGSREMDAGGPLDGDGGALDAGALPADAGAPDAGPGDAGCVSTNELCDAADNDCDGAVDEDDACGCPARTRDGRVYLFCPQRESWEDARSYCTGRGYDLTVLLTAAEETWVWDQTRMLSGDTDTWMGLTDQAVEGEYRWLDGTLIWQAGAPVGGAHNNWRGGSPDELQAEDCVELDNGGGQWADERCAASAPFVCEAEAR